LSYFLEVIMNHNRWLYVVYPIVGFLLAIILVGMIRAGLFYDLSGQDIELISAVGIIAMLAFITLSIIMHLFAFWDGLSRAIWDTLYWISFSVSGAIMVFAAILVGIEVSPTENAGAVLLTLLIIWITGFLLFAFNYFFTGYPPRNNAQQANNAQQPVAGNRPAPVVEQPINARENAIPAEEPFNPEENEGEEDFDAYRTAPDSGQPRIFPHQAIPEEVAQEAPTVDELNQEEVPPVRRSFWIGIISPVLVGIAFLATPYLWEAAVDSDIAWARAFNLIQFKGEVIIPFASEADAKEFAQHLCLGENKYQKISETSLLLRKQLFRADGKTIERIGFANLTFDGTEYSPVYFYSGDQRLKLDIEQRE